MEKVTKFSIGDNVIVKSNDFYGGIRGIVKGVDEVSILSNIHYSFIISIIDSEAFEKKYPRDKVGNHTLESVYVKKEITISHINLELDKQWYREKRLKDILGDE